MTKGAVGNDMDRKTRKALNTGEWYNTDQDNIEAEIRFLEGLL